MTTETDRRDFLVAGAALAATALAAAPKPAAAQATGGRLTVHILDLYSGTPANGIRIDLVALEGGAAKTLKSVVANADGRPPEGPFLTPETIKPGRYQITASGPQRRQRCKSNPWMGVKVPAMRKKIAE